MSIGQSLPAPRGACRDWRRATAPEEQVTSFGRGGPCEEVAPPRGVVPMDRLAVTCCNPLVFFLSPCCWLPLRDWENEARGNQKRTRNLNKRCQCRRVAVGFGRGRLASPSNRPEMTATDRHRCCDCLAAVWSGVDRLGISADPTCPATPIHYVAITAKPTKSLPCAHDSPQDASALVIQIIRKDKKLLFQCSVYDDCYTPSMWQNAFDVCASLQCLPPNMSTGKPFVFEILHR
jgi:hypothetical protein